MDTSRSVASHITTQLPFTAGTKNMHRHGPLHGLRCRARGGIPWMVSAYQNHQNCFMSIGWTIGKHVNYVHLQPIYLYYWNVCFQSSDLSIAFAALEIEWSILMDIDTQPGVFEQGMTFWTGYPQKKGRRVRWQTERKSPWPKNNDNHQPRHYEQLCITQDSKKTISYKSAKKRKSEIWTRRIDFNELSFTIPLSRTSPVPSNSYISCDGVLLPTGGNEMNPGITRQTIQSHPPPQAFSKALSIKLTLIAP